MKLCNGTKVRMNATLLLHWLNIDHLDNFIYFSMSYIVFIGCNCLYVRLNHPKYALKYLLILAVNNIQNNFNKGLVFHF